MKTKTKIFTLIPKFSAPKRFSLMWGSIFLAIFVVGGFGLGKVEKANAWSCVCSPKTTSSQPTTLDAGDLTDCTQNYFSSFGAFIGNPTSECNSACDTKCQTNGYPGGEAITGAQGTLLASQGAVTDKTGGVCPGLAGGLFMSPLKSIVNCLLLIVLSFLGLIIQLAGALFAWMVDPKNMSAVMDNQIVYQIWGQVRDVLNISFILVLLFSAFCTIFGIDKYSYKKILLTLIIMALLVNFSFPIARFIIDLSNVIMYYFINNLGFNNLSQTFPGLAKDSGLYLILHPNGGVDADTSYLLAAVVFSFIFAVSLLVISVLFLIRIVVLTILIIFSSIAFVGSIVPFLSSQAGKWWDNLFKYAFFGPVMLFMMYISTQMMGAIGKAGGTLSSSLNTITGTQSSNPSIIAALTFFTIPIVILWIGIGFAQQLSIAGAGVARKIGFGAVGWATGLNWGKQQYKDYKKERAARKEEARWKTGKWAGDKVNDKQDSILAGLRSKKAQKRMDKRRTDKNKKEIDEGAKDLVDKGATTDSLAQQMNTHFGAPPPTTKQAKVDQAKVAAAYLRQDSDERKMHIQNTITANGGYAGSDLGHILDAAPPVGAAVGSAAYNSHMNARFQARMAAAAIAGGSTQENDIRKVAAFVNSQMKHRVDLGANAS